MTELASALHCGRDMRTTLGLGLLLIVATSSCADPYGNVHPREPATASQGQPQMQAEAKPAPSAPAPQGLPANAPIEQKALVTIKHMQDALNAHDVDRWSQGYSPDASLTVIPLLGAVRGRAAIKADQEGFLTAFPDMKIAANRIWQAKDVAVVEWIQNATHTGDFMGLKATKKPTGQIVLSVMQFGDDGLVKDEHLYYDGATLLAQITGKGIARPIPPMPTMGNVYVATGSPEEAQAVDVAKRIMADREKNDVNDFLSLLGDDFELSATMAPQPEKGKAVAKQSFERFEATFPHAKYDVTRALGVNGFAILEYAVKGTQDGPIGPLPASHRPVDWHWVEVYEVKEGKAQRAWAYANMIELLTEIAPPRGETPPGAPPATTPPKK